MMKLIARAILLITITIITLIASASAVSAHNIVPWATKYPGPSARGEYEFGFWNSGYHIDGSVVNYYWGSTAAKTNFGTALTDGISDWGGLISGSEKTTATGSHMKINYDPYLTHNNKAVDGLYQSGTSGDGHLSLNGGATLSFGNIASSTAGYKKHVAAHELGHAWRLMDLSPDNVLYDSIFRKYNTPYSPTRHDKNAMRIGLNNLRFETAN